MAGKDKLELPMAGWNFAERFVSPVTSVTVFQAGLDLGVCLTQGVAVFVLILKALCALCSWWVLSSSSNHFHDPHTDHPHFPQD